MCEGELGTALTTAKASGAKLWDQHYLIHSEASLKDSQSRSGSRTFNTNQTLRPP
jgi:hypothetical protein